VACGVEGEKNDVRLEGYVTARVDEFPQISADRRAVLKDLATYIAARRNAGKVARLLFASGHDSQRTQLARIWAAVGAAQFRVDGVEAYSGGADSSSIETGAFDALRRAGFSVVERNINGRTQFEVAFASQLAPLSCFPKEVADATNPESDFCAVMLCAEDDETCPLVRGAASVVALPYQERQPTIAAKTSAEPYDKLCAEIAREMLYVFAQIK
jgi:hypothetical protein